METQLVNFLLCLIEYLSIYILLHYLLVPRFQSFYPTIIAAVINSIAVYLMPDFSALKISLCVICVFIGSCIVYKAKPYIHSAFSITFVYSLCIIDIVIGNFFSIVLDKQFLEVFYSDIIIRLFVCMFIKLIDIFVWVFLYNLFKKSGLNLERRVWILFNIVMFVFLVVTVMYMAIYPTTSQDSQSALLYMLVSVSFLIMSIIVIYFFTSICASFKQKEKLFLLQASYDSIEEKLSVQKQNSEKLQRVRHDIRNHLINAKLLLENNDKDSAVLLLSDIIGQTDNITLSISQSTGNNIIDTIVAFKATVCENRNISFEYELDVLPELEIDYADISSVISNLIDNAVEATEKSDKPYIMLKISVHGSYLDIFVKNTYNGKVNVDDKHTALITTKNDADSHGYGTRIIKEIAEKYDGNYSWKEYDTFFIANVLLKHI